MLTELTNYLSPLLAGQWGRLLATVAVAGAGFGLWKLWVRYLTRQAAGENVVRLRHRLVWAKNLLWVTCTLIILLIWASSLAGFALSLAAVAGAMLIVSKELLMCGLGYGVLTLSRPYSIGDYVEVGPYAGRVIDVDVFGTTLAETSNIRQLNGKTVVFPNSMLLSNPVRNHSATGQYVLNLYRIVVPADADLELAEDCALKAAREVCAPWRDAAAAHIERLGARHHIDLPSAREKVLWEPMDTKAHGLVVRFACPMQERVTAEQEIFRRFWKAYRAAVPKKAEHAE